MPHGKTKFNQAWLNNRDSQGFLVGQWCKADEANTKALCTVCGKSFNVDNSGFQQILAHSKGLKHQNLTRAKLSPSQSHFKVNGNNKQPAPIPCSSKTETTDRTQPILDKCTNDLVTQAEILWALKISQGNFSYRSCDDIPALFKKMFPGNVVAENFSMSRTKISYLISDGLGPFFRKELCAKVSLSPGYVIQYDETANSQVRKQCDIIVRYWSEEKGQVVAQFLKAAMFGHATGESVAKCILETLQEPDYEIPLNKLLNLGSDGPNVNKTVWE